MHPFRYRTAPESRLIVAGKVLVLAVLAMSTHEASTSLAWAQAGTKSKPKVQGDAPPAADPGLPEPATVEVATRVLDLREFPTMEGAAIQGARRLGQLSYQAKASPKAAFEFQRRNLLERGWKEASGSQIDAAYATGQFGKGGFLVYVFTSELAGDPAKAGWSQVMVVNHGNVLTGTLPVPAGAKSFYPDATAAAYVTEAPVPETSEACRELLLAEQWAPYGSAGAKTDSAILFFKQNAIRLRVWVSKAPAEGNKTVIRYSTELLSADIPIPPDAPDPRYDDGQKVVSFDWPDENSVPVLAFYRVALAQRHWSPTTELPTTGAKKKKEFQIYRNPRGEMMSVDVEQFTGISRVKVQHRSIAEAAELDRKAAEETARLAQEKTGDKTPAAAPQASAKVSARSRRQALAQQGEDRNGPRTTKLPDHDAELPEVQAAAKLLEDLGRELVADPQTLEKPAITARKTKAEPVETKPKSAPGPTAKVADIPVPEDAAKIERNETTKMITLASPSDVKALAAFYVDGLTKQGWEKGSGSLVTDESAMLKLAKGDASLTIFIDRSEEVSDVTLMTRGVEWDAAATPAGNTTAKVETPSKAETPSKPSPPDPTTTKPALPKEEPKEEPKQERPAENVAVGITPAPPAEKPAATPDAPDSAAAPSDEPEPGKIIAKESNGLPVPQENTERTSTSTPIRKSVGVVTSLEMEPLVEFYRHELGARGWTETADSAEIAPKKSQLSFTGPEGELHVRLSRKGEYVNVLVASRSPDKAKGAGILPQPNRGRIVLANSQNQEARLTINGQPYKLGPGLGSKDPKEGKSLHVLPGRYRLVIKGRGETDKPQDINIRLDETWGVTILPTGGLAIDQIY